MLTKRKVAILGAILLGILVCILLPEKLQNGSSSHHGAHQSDRELQASAQTDKPRSKRREKSSSEKIIHATHSYAELKDFMIPELKLEGVTFKQALYQLRKQYYEICRQTGEKPIPLKLKTKGASNRTLNIKLTNMSFISMLHTLSAIEGMKHEVDGIHISFTTVMETGMQITKKMNISPLDMNRSIQGLYPSPILTSKERPISILSELESDLVNLLGKAIDTSWESITSNISITADSTTIERIESLIEHYLQLPPLQIKTSSHIIKVEEGASFDPAWLNQPDFHRNLQSTEGITISSAPTTISRPGEHAKIELLREYIYPNDSGDFIQDHIGITIEHNTNLLGFGIGSEIQHDQGYLTGEAKTPVKHNTTTHQGYSQGSAPGIIPLKTHDGTLSYLIYKHEVVDATGKKVALSR